MRWLVPFLSIAFAAVLTTATVDAQRRGGDPKLAARKNPSPATQASITAGRALYNKNCRHCHGLKALGDGPLAPRNPKPSNLTDSTWDHGGSDGEIFAIIWNGAPATNSEMKPMKGTLTEKNVWDIVNYLRTLGPKPGAAKPAAKS
jgi:mono/diheme cytochrome c family protein